MLSIADMRKTKRCAGCEKLRPRALFTRSRSTADGLHRYCRDCLRVARRQQRWGLTQAEWESKLEAQSFRCAVPGCPGEPTCLDHSHDHEPRDPAGHRGIVCQGCNLALGHIANSPRRARGLASYLERFAAHSEAP